MEKTVVTDLYVLDREKKEECRIPIVYDISYDEQEDRLIIHSYGMRYFIRHIENYSFRFEHRVIDNRSPEITSEEIKEQ